MARTDPVVDDHYCHDDVDSSSSSNASDAAAASAGRAAPNEL